MSGSSNDVSRRIAQSFANIDEVYNQAHRLGNDLVREADLGLQEMSSGWVRNAIAGSWLGETDWHIRYVSNAWTTERTRYPHLAASHGLVFFSLIFTGTDKLTIPVPLLVTGFHGNDRADSMPDVYRDLWYQRLYTAIESGKSLGAARNGDVLQTKNANATLQFFAVSLTSLDSLETAGPTVLEPLRSLAKGQPATPPSAVTETWMLKE